MGYHVVYTRRLLRAGTVSGERIGQVWLVDQAEVARVKSLQGKGARLPKSSTRR